MWVGAWALAWSLVWAVWSEDNLIERTKRSNGIRTSQTDAKRMRMRECMHMHAMYVCAHARQPQQLDTHRLRSCVRVEMSVMCGAADDVAETRRRRASWNGPCVTARISRQSDPMESEQVRQTQSACACESACTCMQCMYVRMHDSHSSWTLTGCDRVFVSR